MTIRRAQFALARLDTNAVKTQIWTAVGVYALAAIIKKELALDVSLYTFLQILSVHSFEKIQLSYAFQGGDNANCDDPCNRGKFPGGGGVKILKSVIQALDDFAAA